MNKTAEIIIIAIICSMIGFVFGVASEKRDSKANNMFCPECGRHYQDVQYCEYDGTELKEIQK